MKENELILSIIVPVYNAEQYLEECLRSLFTQDLPADAYEVIAVDNGSRDGSAAMIKQLQNEYANLRLLTLAENQLPSGGRNAGMDAAQGKYLMFVDSDDYLYPNVLHSLVDAIEKDYLDFAHFDADFLTDGQIVIGQRTANSSILSGVEFYHTHPYFHEVSWSKIYRRSFIEQNHMRCVVGLLYEDDEFSYRLYSLAKRVRHVEIIPYVFRKHGSSATQRRTSLTALSSYLVEINTLYEDIHGEQAPVADSNIKQEIIQVIRHSIWEIFETYKRLDPQTKKEALAQMQKYFTWRMLPYMSVKRYMLLKLGIIK